MSQPGRRRLAHQRFIRTRSLEFASCHRQDAAVPQTSSFFHHLLLAPVLTSLACCVGACRKPPPVPTEKLLVTTSLMAPGLAELEDDEGSDRTVFRGDVLISIRRIPNFRWKGAMEGKMTQREGEVIEASRTPADGPSYVFASDMTEMDVPQASWMCAKMGNPVIFNTPCDRSIRRISAPGGRFIAWLTCVENNCPVAELSDGTVTSTTIPALSSLRLVTFGSQSVVLAWSRWVRSSDWTGGNLILMLASPPLRRIGEIPMDEVDARDPVQVLNRLGTLEILDDGVRYKGKRAMIERQTGKELSATAFDERYWVTPEGKFVGQK